MDKPIVCTEPHPRNMSRAAWIAEGYARRIRLRTADYERACVEYEAAWAFTFEVMSPAERYADRLEERSRYMTLRWRLKGLPR